MEEIDKRKIKTDSNVSGGTVNPVVLISLIMWTILKSYAEQGFVGI